VEKRFVSLAGSAATTRAALGPEVDESEVDESEVDESEVAIRCRLAGAAWTGRSVTVVLGCPGAAPPGDAGSTTREPPRTSAAARVPVRRVQLDRDVLVLGM
jgi:hypothetical protein